MARPMGAQPCRARRGGVEQVVSNLETGELGDLVYQICGVPKRAIQLRQAASLRNTFMQDALTELKKLSVQTIKHPSWPRRLPTWASRNWHAPVEPSTWRHSPS